MFYKKLSFQVLNNLLYLYFFFDVATRSWENDGQEKNLNTKKKSLAILLRFNIYSR